MITAHKADIAGIAKGDKYGKNIVDLYNLSSTSALRGQKIRAGRAS
jgi:hypothetical protein